MYNYLIFHTENKQFFDFFLTFSCEFNFLPLTFLSRKRAGDTYRKT